MADGSFRTIEDIRVGDVVLPGGMSGKELAHKVRRRDGNVKVLLTLWANSKDGKPGEEFDLLPKPYTLNELTKRMRSVLEG